MPNAGQPCQQAIPWSINKDSTVLALVTTSVGEAGTLVTQKSTTTLADMICNIARTRGVVEARVVDHSLSGMTKVGMSIFDDSWDLF